MKGKVAQKYFFLQYVNVTLETTFLQSNNSWSSQERLGESTGPNFAIPKHTQSFEYRSSELCELVFSTLGLPIGREAECQRNAAQGK